jgi:3',5'-cyclic AMP phosphodiesterase CpdA
MRNADQRLIGYIMQSEEASMTRSLRALTIVCMALATLAAFGASDPIKSINGKLVSPAASGDFVFVVAGDNRPTAKGAPSPRVLETIFSEIRIIQPDLVLWSGDTIYGYGDTPEELQSEYSGFLARAKRADVPIFNVPGNHEIHPQKPCSDPDPEQQFKNHFGNLYGSFDYRGAHFIALDTEECGHTTPDGKVQVVDGAQLDWLKQDLEANKAARAMFVFFHTEVTPASNDEDSSNHKALGNSDELRTLFKAYPVKAVFQGHEHVYYGTVVDGIQYFVAGGAGAPLYAPPEKGGFSHYLVVEVTGDNVNVKVVEPGHLYVEAGKSTSAAERSLWIVNSTDMALPVRRVETSVPLSLGTCAELVAESRLTTWNGKAIPVPVSIAKCVTSGKKRALTIAVTGDVPRRSSVPIVVHKQSAQQ